jgi:class 3 adenylate cyclase
VLFCDLVDSTGIASRLDAEEWQDLVDTYFEVASVAVTEMGGTIAKKLGDGLMALFTSLEQLEEHINAFMAALNETATPFA